MPTSPTPITALSDPPSTGDPVNFDERADNLFDQLHDLTVDEVNALGAVTYDNAVEAEASATKAENYAGKTDGYAADTDNSAKSWAVGGTGSGQPAAGDAKSWATSTTTVAGGLKGAKGYAEDAASEASDAAASAASALNAPATSATSPTEITIGTGEKVFTLTQTGKTYSVGQRGKAFHDGDNGMYFRVTDFADPDLTVDVDAVVGSGTYASWSIALSPTSGPDKADQATAEAGADDTLYMTPLGTAQAIRALGSVSAFAYGDRSDGDVVITGATTLTRDMFYGTVSWGPAGALNVNGHRIFADTVDLRGAPAGAIFAPATTTGSTVGGGASTAGTAGHNGGASGTRGTGGSIGGQTGVASSTAPTPDLALRHLARTKPTLSDFSETLATGGSMGPAGIAGQSTGDGYGGNGGMPGRGAACIAIFARRIIRDETTAAGAISAPGGDGGNGGNGVPNSGTAGGGGGGPGGGGGWLLIITDKLEGAIAPDAVDLTGGAGGDGGAGAAARGGRGGYSGAGGRLTAFEIGAQTYSDTLSTAGEVASAVPVDGGGTAGAAPALARFDL